MYLLKLSSLQDLINLVDGQLAFPKLSCSVGRTGEIRNPSFQPRVVSGVVRKFPYSRSVKILIRVFLLFIQMISGILKHALRGRLLSNWILLHEIPFPDNVQPLNMSHHLKPHLYFGDFSISQERKILKIR